MYENIKKNNAKNEIVILTATSGDTGKAALAGFAEVPGTKIIVFYPKNGVSPIQEKQMVTQKGDNTFVVGITGNFDDAQTGVKRIFADPVAKEKLLENSYVLSSANSINWGRLAPQIVYYFYSTDELGKEIKQEGFKTTSNDDLRLQVEMVSQGFDKDKFGEIAQLRKTLYAEEKDNAKAISMIKEYCPLWHNPEYFDDFF